MSKPIHILVADDNEVNQRVILGMLEHAGYSVDLAGDGREAIERLSESSYDLLILDCMMPVMDGFETTRAIRDSDGSSFDPDIPILAVTALATSDDRDRCRECGMDDYIAKPVIVTNLYARINRILEKKQQAGHSKTLAKQSTSVAASRGKPGNEKSVDLVQVVRSMSTMIIRDAESWIIALSQLQAGRDWIQLSGLAHKIRGTADVLNESRLSLLARNLEQSSKSEDDLATVVLTRGLVTELQRLVVALGAQSSTGS